MRLDAESETLVVGFYGNDNGRDAAIEQMPTLRANEGGGGNHPAVAFQGRGRDTGRDCTTQEEQAYAITSPNGGGRRQELNALTPRMAVRRLTVVECSRLQGFPDTYLLDVPWKTRKIGDEEAAYLLGHGVRCWMGKGLWRTECAPDAPMYRALGNSMCTNVMQWIGKRIDEVDKRMNALDSSLTS